MYAQKHSYTTGGCLGKLNGPVTQHTSAALTFTGSLPSCEGRGAMSFRELRKGLLLTPPPPTAPPLEKKVPFQVWKENGRLERKCLKAQMQFWYIIVLKNSIRWAQPSFPVEWTGLGKLLQAGQSGLSKMQWRKTGAKVDSLAHGPIGSLARRGSLAELGFIEVLFYSPGKVSEIKSYHWGRSPRWKLQRWYSLWNRWQPPCLPGGRRGDTGVTKKTKRHLFLDPVWCIDGYRATGWCQWLV